MVIGDTSGPPAGPDYQEERESAHADVPRSVGRDLGFVLAPEADF